MNAITNLSNDWFPAKERVIMTSVANIAIYAGVCFAYV